MQRTFFPRRKGLTSRNQTFMSFKMNRGTFSIRACCSACAFFVFTDGCSVKSECSAERTYKQLPLQLIDWRKERKMRAKSVVVEEIGLKVMVWSRSKMVFRGLRNKWWWSKVNGDGKRYVW